MEKQLDSSKNSTSDSGYMSPAYSASLSSWGEPLALRHSGGWLLARNIPGSQEQDAMGCYPIFCCRDWEKLDDDLAGMNDRFVTISLVTDPFASVRPDVLSSIFPHKCIPFKTHLVADLSAKPDKVISAHHRRKATRALRSIKVETCVEPIVWLDNWCELYSALIKRHRIVGPTRFSREIFKAQLLVPGAVLFRAEWEGTTVGMSIWYQHNNVAYYHLGASNENGYNLEASYGLFFTAWEWFASRAEWLALGGDAGHASGNSGLLRFKRGWASGVRMAYFCGRVSDERRYSVLNPASTNNPTYFPAYRIGEFGESEDGEKNQ